MMSSIVRGTLAAIVVSVTVLAAGRASAGVTPEDYRRVGVSPPPDARAPLAAVVMDESGQPRSLRQLLSHPAVLVFADYTCRTLCGPVVAFVASALEQSGLKAGEQFQLIVVSINPEDGAADAARMRRNYVGSDAALNGASVFVIAGRATTETLTAALGYRYFHDVEHDQFVHPAAAFVLAADGRVVRLLGGLGLSGHDMRLALVEAGKGRVGTLGDQVRLLCSGFDPVHGTYNLMISRLLALCALVTIGALGGGIGLLVLADRRRRPAETPSRP